MKKEYLITILAAIFTAIITVFAPEIKSFIMTLNAWDILFLIFFAITIVSFFLGRIRDLKEKILCLKKYRDYESVRVLNSLNANIEILQQKIDFINDKVNAYNDIDFIDPISETARKKRALIFDKELKQYNEAFKKWKCDELGKDHLSIIKIKKD